MAVAVVVVVVAPELERMECAFDHFPGLRRQISPLPQKVDFVCFHQPMSQAHNKKEKSNMRTTHTHIYSIIQTIVWKSICFVLSLLPSLSICLRKVEERRGKNSLANFVPSQQKIRRRLKSKLGMNKAQDILK